MFVSGLSTIAGVGSCLRSFSFGKNVTLRPIIRPVSNQIQPGTGLLVVVRFFLGSSSTIRHNKLACYIFSGVVTPKIVRPLTKTCWMQLISNNLALRNSFDSTRN